MPAWCRGWGPCPLLAPSPTLMHSCLSFVFQTLFLSLQEHFSDHIEGTLQRNSLCNLLVFNYTVSSDSKTFPFNVRLLYGDLCCSLPTEAIISCTRKWAVQVSGCVGRAGHTAVDEVFSRSVWGQKEACCHISLGGKIFSVAWGSVAGK